MPSSPETVIKTIVNLDLKNYTSAARVLQEHISAHMVGMLDEQIQTLINAGLKSAGAERNRAVIRTTGDGAILVPLTHQFCYRRVLVISRKCDPSK